MKLNLDLEILFREYFSKEKKRIYSSLKEENNNFFECTFDEIDISKANIVREKRTSYSVFKDIGSILEENEYDDYYRILYKILNTRYSYEIYYFDEIEEEIDSIGWEKDYSFLYLKILCKGYQLRAKMSNYVSFHYIPESEKIYERTDYFLKEFFLKKEKLKYYHDEILNGFMRFNNENNFDGLFLFLSKFLIKEILYINFMNKYERKVAHYTSLEVAVKLIKGKSKFWLASSEFMNDPHEGVALDGYLNRVSNFFNNHDFKYTYLSCFTFNHNSLNQFRLYGRTNNVECSGVSLALNKNFFYNGKNKLLRLYRCAYIEPNTGYVQVAGRDKFTFIQEFNSFNAEIESRWVRYEELLKFKSIAIMSLIKIIKHSIYLFDLSGNFVDLVLEDVKFLFKNFSFKEEQECRVVLVSNLNNSKILNFKTSYIEYSANFYSSIENIYIGEASKNMKTYLSYELLSQQKIKKKPKVKISEHPFRPVEYLSKI